MNTNKKTPKLRFKGFSDDWEQRKLLTVLNKIVDYRGRTPKKLGLDWSLNGHLALSALNVKMGYVDKTVDAHYGDDHLYSVWMKDNDLYEGQVLFTTEAPMGNVAQVPDNNKYILSQRTIAFVPDRSVISDNFLAVVLSASKCQKSLINRASGGTAKGVSQKTLSEIFLDIPQSLSEQDKVSELIKKLSKIITLHQCKLEKLKLTKKALLQKLFPKNGKRIPEIRFKGFTDAWEQRNLESLFTKYEDKVKTPNSGYWRLGLRSHCKGTFHTYVDAGNELETAEMNRVQSGNFILNITFAWERALAVTNEEDQDKLVSHRFPQFKPNSDLAIDFFKHTLIDKRFKHHLELSSPGGAGRNKVLKIADMLKYELLVPSIKEQNEISSFLNNVDYIITLYQRKLDRLISIKKALLQQLFV